MATMATTMIRLTAAAAKQVLQSAIDGKMEGLALRVSVVRDAEGRFQYGMGFDDQSRPDDQAFESEGVAVVVSEVSLTLLKDTTIDYVDLGDGSGHHFIFLNPNDPAYVPPKQ